MMRRLLLPVLAALSLLVTASARAEVHTHADAKVSLDVPTGWKIETEGDTMTIEHPSGEIAFFLFVVDAKDLDTATSAIDTEIAKVVKDVKWEDKPSEHKLNGMDSVSVDGEGKIEGKKVDLGVLLVVTPAKKVLCVLGAVESSKAKKHQKAVEKLVSSIKPAK